MQNPTTNDYPKEASFVLEYNHGHIPQMVFQTSHKEDYRMFLEKHMGITRVKDATIGWDLLSDSINQLNLAKLVPVLTFVNNEWGTAIRMHKYFKTNPKCPMCDLEENKEHVFSCNSATVKKTHHEALKLIK